MPKVSKLPKPVPPRASQRRRPKWATSAEAVPNNEESRYNSRAILRALDVLEAFDAERPILTLKDLTGLTGVSDSSLFRVLISLQGRGYLQQNADGSYQLAPKVLHGRLHEHAEKVRETAHPELQRLAAQLNETASLAFLFGHQIQVIDSLDSLHEIRVTNRVGRVLPPHCSAMGKVITAFQATPDIGQIMECYGLVPRTEHSIADRRTFVEHLESVRSTGLAFDREESSLGGICMAAPIRQGSRVVAAISVSTPVVRMNAKREKETAAAVQRSAAAISSLL